MIGGVPCQNHLAVDHRAEYHSVILDILMCSPHMSVFATCMVIFLTGIALHIRAMTYNPLHVQVLQPEDLVNPKVDELSMMTYVSQFAEAKAKEGAPIRRAHAGDASKVKAYGPGLEPEGLSTDDETAEFTIDPLEAGFGTLNVTIDGPAGGEDIILEKNADGTFRCSYVPDAAGLYNVAISWAGQSIPGSPFPVNVAQGSDAGACDAYGPGLEATNLKEGTETEFWVETAGAGEGTLSLSIKGPKGPIYGDMRVEDEGNGKYHVFYTAPSTGQYIIDILFGGLHIAESPYKVHVAQDRANASKCRAEGDGITGKGLEVGKQTHFWVYTKGAGRGDLSVNIRGKSGTVPVECTQKEAGVYECSYLPEEDGEFVITVKYGGENIPGSRFKVTVEPPTDASKCVASGPGLEAQGVRVDIPTKFQVRTKNAGWGEMQVDITGPDNRKLAYDSKSTPYIYNYTYEAKAPGMYRADIQFAGQHVPGSPFPIAVTDTNKVRITGPGMNGEFLPINEPLEYFVDARGAGPGKVGCSVQGPMRPEDYDQSAVKVQDNGDGTFQIMYTPNEAGRLKMNATFAESAIPETPIKLYVYDASQVVAEGKGLEDGNISGELTTFTVDMRKGGEGHLHVGIDGPANTPVTVKDQANNVVNCEYIPLVPGDYDINVLWEGTHIPNSPYHISVRPAIDPTAVKCYGEAFEPGRLFTDMWAEFFVDYKKAGNGELEIKVWGPGGGEELDCEEVEERLRKVRFYIDPEEAGDYHIEVKFAYQDVPGSPFTVHADWATDASRVKAYGPGLEGGIAQQWAEFFLDMTQAGSGNLDVSIEGPGEAEASVDDKGDGTAVVKYLPVDSGEYTVNVSFANEAIPGSPFNPVFMACTDASKVNVHGPGLEPHGVKVGDPGLFTVDTCEAGPGALDVKVDAPMFDSNTLPRSSRGDGKVGAGRKRTSSFHSGARPHITNNNDDTYTVKYNPRKVGRYRVYVTYDGIDTPYSPYTVEVSDPSKVKVRGPGVLHETVQCANDSLDYAVDTTGAGNGELKVTVDGPDGFTEEIDTVKTTDNNYAAKLVPTVPGPYNLHFKFDGTSVPHSPAEVKVVDPSKVKVEGDCFEGACVRVYTPVSFCVDSTAAGEGELEVSLEGPSEATIVPEAQEDGTVKFSFTPTAPGDYNVGFLYAGKPVPGSPFVVKAYDPTKVTASGPGITGVGARVGVPALVEVDTSKAGSAPLSASVGTPSGEKFPLDMQPQKKGIYTADYVPDEPGVFEVDITYGDEAIPESPFQAPIPDPNAVNVQVPEIDEEVAADWIDGVEFAPDVLPIFATVDEPTILDVYTGDAGPGTLDAAFKPADLEQKLKAPVDYEFVEVERDHHQLMFTPCEPKDLDLQLLYNGFEVTDQPQKVVVSNPKVCKAYGPGLESGLLAKNETHFYVNTENAGPGKVSCNIVSNDGDEDACVVDVAGDNLYKVTYTPSKASEYKVDVKFCKGQIDGSPFFVDVCDPSAVKAYGAGLHSAIVDEEAEFFIDTRDAGEGALGISLEGPKKTDVVCECIEEGVFKVTYTPEVAGKYRFDIKFSDVDVPDNPFSVRVERPPPDASKCVVHGIDSPGSFVLDASAAGGNGMLEVCGAGEFVPVKSMGVEHNGDYTFNIKYLLDESGETKISVKWHGVHIPGSPFTVYPDKK